MQEPFARLAQRVGKDDQLWPTARLLFAALDSCLDKRSGRCAPTLARLAGWIGCDRRTVQRGIRQLEAAGYLAVIRSAGRRNAFQLLPSAEDTEAAAADTRGVDVTTTRGVDVLGARDSDRIRVKEQEGKNPGPPPRQGDLFAGEYRAWFTAAVRYYLGDVAELAGLVDWFPAAAADFFLAHSWHRSTDPETAVAWARRLAAIAATSAEVLEALQWALAVPAVDRAGRKIFSRPDHLERILDRIQSQRKRNRARPAAEASPAIAEAPAGPPAWWTSATAAERSVVAAIVRRDPAIVPGGLHWFDRCRIELERMREAIARDMAANVGGRGIDHVQHDTR